MASAIDTNVLLYAADRRDPDKQSAAIEVLQRREGIVLLWQVACEFIAASRKLADRGLTAHEAWDQLSHYLAAYRLVLPGPAVLERAKTLHLSLRWSFWDAMVVAACLEADVSRLYSEDLPGYTGLPGLEVVNPFK